jgi:hypothetical protein
MDRLDTESIYRSDVFLRISYTRIELKESTVGATCHVVTYRERHFRYNEQVDFPGITGVSPTGAIDATWRCTSDRLFLESAYECRAARKLTRDREPEGQAGGWWKLGEWGCWRRASGDSSGCIVAAFPTVYFWNRWIRHPGQTSLLGCLGAISEYVACRWAGKRGEGGERERFSREEMGRRYAMMPSLRSGRVLRSDRLSIKKYRDRYYLWAYS